MPWSSFAATLRPMAPRLPMATVSSAAAGWFIETGRIPAARKAAAPSNASILLGYASPSVSRRAYRILATESTTFHPRLMGRRGAVASNSHLSANAGADVLKAGGNAIDAAVAMALVEGLVNPQMHTIGGECPILLRVAGENRVIALNGNTAAPMRATPAAYRARGLQDVPDSGILAAGVPAAFGALLTALTRWGTMSLRDLVAPALELAKHGFPVSEGLRNQHK
ncbi:MAG: hypothetical protein FJY40_05340, partial [Betaproteobacteria bacterium]|nr:hypothetical protein [Betaproteobacteria bacterium]